MRQGTLVSLVLLLFVAATAFAGPYGKIAGRVTDAETGQPLPGVGVVIEGTTLGGSTKVEGFYTILNVLPGRYTLRFSMVGYTRTAVTDIDLEGGGRVFLEMTDGDPQEVEVGLPVEITFRRLHEGAHFHNYFWKCRPVR